MLMINTKTKSLMAAAACTVFIALPVLADDTELLLVTPDPDSLPKPNVLFILDTSGSMRTEEETKPPYDPNKEYDGECNDNQIYWTASNLVPDCNVVESSNRAIGKENFHCDAAALPLSATGTYTGVMAQYREDDAGLFKIWMELEYNNDEDPVECQADSGEHGDGTAGEVYATALSDQDNPWTSDSNLEVSWGSAPRTTTYTVWDGNYLNWKNTTETVRWSRNRIMEAVVTNVLNSVSNMNVGVMRFNYDDGGVVIEGLKDLDDNRAQILATVDGLDADGYTPLAETMNEAAQYWHGINGHYAGTVSEYTTDPIALEGGTGNLYKSPAVNSCAKNYNVLLTDGQPVRDSEAQTLTPALPNFATLLNRTACDGSGEGRCLDDISAYLAVADLDPSVPGVQNVVTHTIGFTIDLPILLNTAEVSGGEYFLADDVESLTLALTEIVANINTRALSFTAPAVSVNTFNRTQNINRLYLTMFGAKGNVHWPGNLKRYGIESGQIVDSTGAAAVNPATGFFYDDARSFWNDGNDDGNQVTLGGAAYMLPDPANRNLFTNRNGNELSQLENHVSPANANAFTDPDFGLSGVAGEPSREELIRWARGEDIKDEDDDPATTVRKAMGDPLHSQPAAIVYGGTPASPEIVVFTGTNDGYLHAIDGTTGEELWSFIPFELLDNLALLYDNPKSSLKNYGIDGDIVPIVKDENNNGIIDGQDYVYIIFGMRRGGTTYYALDVTNKNAPKLKWLKAYDNFGQTWSRPVVTRIDVGGGQSDDNAVIVIGDGYDAVHDSGPMPSDPDASGAGIHFLDVEDGKDLWNVALRDADLELDKMTRSIPAQIRVLDISGDGFADRMYAADMGGQVWRFDIYNGQDKANLVTGGVIAQLGAEGTGATDIADNRRFYNTPDVSLFTDPLQVRRYLAISIGSGYRAHPLDNGNTDRFYSLRDPEPFRKLTQDEYDDYDIIVDEDLVEVGGDSQVQLEPADRGWKFTLPADQKVLANSITFNNEVFFVAFSPNADTQSNCSTGAGTNYLYRVSVINGDPVVDDLDALLDTEADDARRGKLAQAGIAPSPTILFPSPDDPDTCKGEDCMPPPIGCVGVECFNPGFVNLPVRTLWTQDGIQ